MEWILLNEAAISMTYYLRINAIYSFWIFYEACFMRCTWIFVQFHSPIIHPVHVQFNFTYILYFIRVFIVSVAVISMLCAHVEFIRRLGSANWQNISDRAWARIPSGLYVSKQWMHSNGCECPAVQRDIIKTLHWRRCICHLNKYRSINTRPSNVMNGPRNCGQCEVCE